MSSYLSYGWFKWLRNVDNFDGNSISECNSIEKSPIGYILEVDLEYPDELHILHNDYPLAPEKFAIPYNMSDYFKNIEDEYGTKVGEVKKLIPKLSDKTNYVLHYRKFQL